MSLRDTRTKADDGYHSQLHQRDDATVDRSDPPDSPMHDTLDLMQVTNTLRDLLDDVSAQLFAEIGQLDNLVKEFSALLRDVDKKGDPHIKYVFSSRGTARWINRDLTHHQLEDQKVVIPTLREAEQFDYAVVL